MDNYISRLDEIDKWLFDSFGILPGACSSIENLRHTTARMVAEALWPKELSLKDFEDVAKQIPMPEYPKYLGNGLWQIAENCITSQKGYEEFMKMRKQV